MRFTRFALSSIAFLLGCSTVWGQGKLFELEQEAIRAAVARVNPSVVQISTVGGLEKIGKVLLGTGPTTGLVVSTDGYIISSAFNFAQQPTSILVRLPSGDRWPAKLVATDHSRMLVLLKVQSDEKLIPATPAPEKEIQVGQWAIAVGRTFDGGNLNLSEGIISAKKRIWGRALQSDAKISPANYGGPLIDIQGRVQGVLVPLSPRGQGKVSGVEWYDSGIGFAIPLEHMMKVLPKLKKGEDLHPGIMGLSMRPGNPFDGAPVIAAVRPNSPAYRAGFKSGDVIVKINGQKIIRQIQVRDALGPLYAGELVKVAVLRGKKSIEKDLKLIAKLEPYSRPFLGILPLRVAKDVANKENGEEDKPAGVIVRYVYPNSPADSVGIELDDRIVSVNGQAVAGPAALREAVSSLESGQKAVLEILRGEKNLKLEVSTAKLPESIPAQLPPALKNRKPYLGEQPPVGRQPLKLEEFKNECITYVPIGYDPATPHGVVIWLHEAGGLKTDKQADELVARWQPYCDAHDLILVAPKSADPLKWSPAKEVPFVSKVVEKIRGTYNVDDTRIVVHGYQAGGAMAYSVAFAQRELVRGVAAVDAPLTGRPPENDPVHPLAFYTTHCEKGRVKPKAVQQLVTRLRGMKYPVTVKDLGEAGRNLNEEELAELVRWIDTLDRI